MQRSAGEATKRFTAVAADHGLRPVEPRIWQREAVVCFISTTVELRVMLGAGCDPYVTIGPVGGEQFGLKQVVGDRAPQREGELVSHSGEDEDDVLDRLADLTARYAADLLSGDFSSLPRLRHVRARQTREENIRTFGTSTGETPRFDHRPTLDELFADASNDGIVDARVYQGVWDHEYTLADLATFLGEPETAIQVRLDRWDGLG